MQRTGTLRYVGPPRPAPLHHRPAWGNSSKEPASQVNRGPKKQGRSRSRRHLRPRRFVAHSLRSLVLALALLASVGPRFADDPSKHEITEDVGNLFRTVMPVWIEP